MLIYHILRVIYPSYIHAHLSRDHVSTAPRRRGRHVRRNYWWLNRDFDSSSSLSSSMSSSSFTASASPRPRAMDGTASPIDRLLIYFFFHFFPPGRVPRRAENGKIYWWKNKKIKSAFNLPKRRRLIWRRWRWLRGFGKPIFPQNVYKCHAVLLF